MIEYNELCQKYIIKYVKGHEYKLYILFTVKEYNFSIEKRSNRKAKYLEDELAELIIGETITAGDTINVDYDKEHDKISTSINKPSNNNLITE